MCTIYIQNQNSRDKGQQIFMAYQIKKLIISQIRQRIFNIYNILEQELTISHYRLKYTMCASKIQGIKDDRYLRHIKIYPNSYQHNSRKELSSKIQGITDIRYLRHIKIYPNSYQHNSRKELSSKIQGITDIRYLRHIKIYPNSYQTQYSQRTIMYKISKNKYILHYQQYIITLLIVVTVVKYNEQSNQIVPQVTNIICIIVVEIDNKLFIRQNK
eukprot:TRINITY_DN12398_c0_g1_i6.p2 TRINITY_DN12398_c0_g1~~TRINITY_DN12398_c0_g1_i6.p2  ORF type:complete len:215 (+),score=-20.83 TRINITY_DN12398_c0_g1_i6:499-1143(+)